MCERQLSGFKVLFNSTIQPSKPLSIYKGPYIRSWHYTAILKPFEPKTFKLATGEVEMMYRINLAKFLQHADLQKESEGYTSKVGEV